jgi:LysR family transcriptional regulator, hydrogen peroxide-inducible genes activator
VKPPVTASEHIRLLRFSDPVPSRQIAMVWRRTSGFRDFLPGLAELFGRLPEGLLDRPQDA